MILRHGIPGPLFALMSFASCFRSPGVKELDVGADCPFGEWEVEMRDHTAENLEEFRKEGKYRLHLDKAILRGTEVSQTRGKRNGVEV